MNKKLEEVLRRAKIDLEELKDLKLQGHTSTIYSTTGYSHIKNALWLLEQSLTDKDNRIKELEEEISDRKETEQSLSKWVINLQSKLDEIKEVVYGGFQREEIEDKIKSILKENE